MHRLSAKTMPDSPAATAEGRDPQVVELSNPLHPLARICTPPISESAPASDLTDGVRLALQSSEGARPHRFQESQMIRNMNGRAVGAVLLVLSACVNVLQAQKIRGLVGFADKKGALVGTKAPPIEARTPDGQPVRMTFDAGLPTVLYYFSPTCGWCDRNWTNLEAVAANAKNRYRVVAITSAQGIQSYAEKHALRVEVLEALPENVLDAYRFAATPHTVVVDAYGFVTHEWQGAFMNGVANRVEDLFGLVLPGLSPTRASERPK